MTNQDWLFKEAAPLIVASKAANLNGTQQGQVNGLAWISAKHKTLIGMPTDQATQEFARLDRSVQDSLTQIFGETKYNPVQKNPIETFTGAFNGMFGSVTDAMDKFTDFQGRFWRAAVTMNDMGGWDRAWKNAEDGKRVFDQDREAKLRNIYDADTFMIAKRISMGDSVGSIISDLTTDSQFKTMARMLDGDEKTTQAIRDFDQAHISFGRSVAHIFGLEPDAGTKDQGLEGKVFTLVSGAADAAYDIGLDPTAWVSGGLTAYRHAVRGIMDLHTANAVGGSLSKSQKIFGAIKGKTFTWKETFADERVSKMFDDIGAQVKIANNKKLNPIQRAEARVRIKDLAPTFNDVSISALITRKVTDSEKALKFFEDQDQILKVMTGQSGSMQQMLPAYTVAKKWRKGIETAVMKTTGFDKTALSVDPTAFNGSAFETILHGQDAAAAANVREVRAFGRMAGRMIERAFVDKSIYTGGLDALGRSNRAKSSGSIYTIARLMFDKRDAKVLASMFVGAETEADARRLAIGLYRTLAEKSGAMSTAEGKREVERLFSVWDNASYSTPIRVSDNTAAAMGRTGGLVEPDLVNGERLGTAVSHVKHQMLLPPIADLMKIADGENAMLAKTLGIRRQNQIVTDFWSALNLLPRLGLRSVMDEGLFHALTMPTQVAMNAIRGYQAGVTQRLISTTESAHEVGFVARHVLRPIITRGVNENVIREAARDPKKMQVLLETQLTKSLLGHATFAGRGGKEAASMLSDLVQFGGFEQMRGLSDGMSAAMTTATRASSNHIMPVLDIADSTLKAAMKKDRVALGGKPTLISRGNTTFAVNHHMQLINAVDRNGELGQLAVRFMEDPKAAVDAIETYLKTPAGKKVYQSFDRYTSRHTTARSDAYDFYLHVRTQFTNDLDEVNTALLNKVRPGGFGSIDPVTASKLTHEDILGVADGARTQLFGYAKEMEIYDNLPLWMNKMLNDGFEVADRQLATLTREPAVIAYSLHYRKQLANAEKAMVEKLVTKSKMSREKAIETAKRKYVTISNDMAINRVLGFIDNPNVRSNLAFNTRNIARYYRANEDFYRRAGRVLREHGGQALVRLRMANEGMSHAGFIHEDEQGDKYFTFPVDEIMYNAYATALNAVGVNTMRPMPLTLTGKIKMMTPSLDPESNLPTFAGPLMSVSWSVLKNAGIIPEEYRAGVTKLLFGQYAEGQSWFNQIVPSTLKRAWVAGKAATGGEDDQIASATMKAMAYYAANGMAPGADSTLQEREEFKRNVKATARSIVFLRNTLGIVSPVSPQISDIKDIPKDLLDAGVQPLKTEFQNIVQAEYDKGNSDAWNTAMHKWTKINPGRLVYTVSQAEADTVATIKKTHQSVVWIQQNRSLAEKYREAAVFLMPQANNFDMDAYAFLKREGFTKTKDVDKYFEEIANVVEENRYYDTKKRYEDLIANDPGQMRASDYRAAMDRELSAIKDANPFLRRKFEQRDGSTQLKLDVVGNMREALSSGMVPETDTSRRIRSLLFEFDSAYQQVNNITADTDAASGMRDRLKRETNDKLSKIVGSNPNAILFYETILKRLLD